MNLRKQIIALANLPVCDEPVISAYFDMQQGAAVAQEDFAGWIKVARKTFAGEARKQFDRAAALSTGWLRENAESCRGAALFSRAGEAPLFKSMTFKVPVPTYFQSSDLPAIYPLVELKDRFNRFVVVLTSRESARIVEMTLGDTSLELLTERPEIKKGTVGSGPANIISAPPRSATRSLSKRRSE
ncbi:hypothetical protein N9A94_09660 [Akkermansiaceae bacterium]|nr:hypothetical protein [Akkermansiaceae bacterium]MDA7888538.1 hypothetical protein [Akkermansiaceae bacterium]